MNASGKIGLGTAQWGMTYGIANRNGQPNLSEISQILSLAHQKGISLIDTAYSYGEAEKILGEERVASLGFNIVTKTLPIQGSSISKEDVVLVSRAFDDSLKRMDTDRVYGLLVHNANNLLSEGSNFLWDQLEGFKEQRRVEKIGVSVYHPEQIEGVLKRYNIDLVQVPFSIYDQRFVQTGLFRRLKQAGIEIHSRSVFLQGLILMSPESMPDYFTPIRSHQAKLHKQLNDYGLTPLEGCLFHCLAEPCIDRMIVGCETFDQLVGILNLAEKVSDISLDLESYPVDNETLVDPSRWPK